MHYYPAPDRFQLTALGRRTALLYSLTFNRLVRPGLSQIAHPNLPPHSPNLRAAFRHLETHLTLFTMASTHAQSKLVGLVYATAKCVAMPSCTGKGWLSFLRHWLKFPLTYQASEALEGVPVATIPELFPGKQLGPISIPPESLDRQIWHIRLDEEVLVGLTVQALGARRIFEIGTFEGGTTRLLADKAGEGAEVFTLDLPKAEVAWGIQIGTKFRGSPMEPRVKQLFGNSLEFDFSPYERSIDLVFVDAAHDYPHGFADSRTALRLVRPGGVVLWHDFNAQFPGLVHGIIEATAGLPLKRLGMHSTLGFLRTAS